MLILPDRVVIKVSSTGKTKALEFLNKLCTTQLQVEENGVTLYYSTILMQNGRYNWDFFAFIQNENTIYLDVHGKYTAQVMEFLNFHKIFAKVEVEDVSNIFKIGYSDDVDGHHAICGCHDPRNINMFGRFLIESNVVLMEDKNQYHTKRIILGIVEGAYDLKSGKAIILEYGFEEINGISFNKGCYIGQELMSRTKYLGEIRKRVYLVSGRQDVNMDQQGVLIEKNEADVVNVGGEVLSGIEFKDGSRVNLVKLNIEDTQKDLKINDQTVYIIRNV